MKTQLFTYHDNNKRGTVVGIVSGSFLNLGLAMRNYQDQFSRKLGRVIATGRAVKNPIEVIDIQDRSMANVIELFYEKAPWLIQQKRDQILARV